jgi:hypothetical protein
MIKAEIRIPTTQFGFITLNVEVEDAAAAIAAHNEAVKLYNTPPEAVGGLTVKEMNACLDEFLLTGTVKGGIELWEKMNPMQKEIFQTIKRATKRLEAKNK